MLGPGGWVIGPLLPYCLRMVAWRLYNRFIGFLFTLFCVRGSVCLVLGREQGNDTVQDPALEEDWQKTNK